MKAFFTLDEFARSCCNVGIMQCLEVEFWKVSNLPESSLLPTFLVGMLSQCSVVKSARCFRSTKLRSDYECFDVVVCVCSTLKPFSA